MARFGMVIDVDRCVGCQTCVVSCQMNHALKPGHARNSVDTLEWGRWPEGDVAFFSHGCLHCEDPRCVQVCPTAASIQRDDGIIAIRPDLCIGCGVCITACAYGARSLCLEEGFHFGAAKPAPYEAEQLQPVGVVDKCSFCSERVDEGRPPACVQDCVMSVRMFGDLDDPESDLHAFLAEHPCIQVPNTSVFYHFGNRDVNLEEFIKTGYFTSAKDERLQQETPQRTGNPAVVGAAFAATAAIATGLGVSAKRSRAKRNGG